MPGSSLMRLLLAYIAFASALLLGKNRFMLPVVAAKPSAGPQPFQPFAFMNESAVAPPVAGGGTDVGVRHQREERVLVVVRRPPRRVRVADPGGEVRAGVRPPFGAQRVLVGGRGVRAADPRAVALAVDLLELVASLDPLAFAMA